MKTIHTPLVALAALTLLPATGWSQDQPQPQRERMRAEMERRIEKMRESNRELPPEARRMLEMAKRERGAARPDTDSWRIGVMVDPVPPLLREHLKLPKGSGVVVDRVVDGGPAAKAGLRTGDLILAAGDKPVGDLESLRNAVTRAGKEGKPLVLRVMKQGKPAMVTIKPPERPKPPVRERAKPRPEVARDVPPAAKPGPGIERMANALREMRTELDKQREAIRRLEKRVEEMSRPHKRD